MDPRIGLTGGFALQIISGLWLMAIDLNVDAATLMANSLVQGIAIGVIWVPLTLVTFSTISSANLAEGTAVYHLLRNIGSSFFISICVAEIVRATSANYSRLIEMMNPFNRSLALPWVTGAWDPESLTGLAKLSKEIGRQASMLGYIHAFGFYTLASALAIPLILFVGRRARMR
jgi:DHA2 family multidrug resistance protein